MVLLQDCEVGSPTCGTGDCCDWKFGVDVVAVGVLCEVRTADGWQELQWDMINCKDIDVDDTRTAKHEDGGTDGSW